MNISSTEILIVLVVALIVLGPQRLPDAMKTAGKAYREFRKVSGTVQREINEVVNETTGMFTSTADVISGKSPTGRNSTASKPVNASYRPADEIPADEIPADELPASETPVGELPANGAAVAGSTVAGLGTTEFSSDGAPASSPEALDDSPDVAIEVRVDTAAGVVDGVKRAAQETAVRQASELEPREILPDAPDASDEPTA